MTTWNFTADSTSVIKTLQDADPPREQTFNDLSLRMVDTIIYLYEAGQYASAVKFEQIGTIDGVAPTDLQDAFDKILAIIPASGGSGSQGLESVLTVGNESTTKDAIFRVDANKFLKINRASQTIEFWDLAIDAVDPISVFSASQISLKNGANTTSLEPNYLALSDGSDNLEITQDRIIFNSVDYPFPTGVTSPLATLADITGGATNLGYTASPTNGIVTSDTGTDATLPLADTTNAGLLNPADFTQLSNLTTNLASKEIKLSITALKTANYSVLANEFVPVDLTSGSVVLTLPTAPADGTQCGTKLSVLVGTNTITINTGGSDVINVVGGASTASLSVLNQVVIFKYKASLGVWYAVDTSISKTYIDTQDALKKDKSLDALVLQGKTIVLFGDSYTSGSGATNAGRRYSTLFCNGLGAFESNQGVQGTTMEKRVPVNYINSPNMVDNATNIPTYVATTHGMLVLQFGLNDVGQNGANYTTANYITDAQTVLTTAISTKGWPANKILMIGTPYIGSAGYAAYAVLSGNSAPTIQRHLDFIEAQKTVATTNGTLFIDIYQLQVKNDIANTIAVDNIHPNDAGHYAIARMLLNFIGFSAMFETRVSLSTSNPWHGGLGGTFSNSAGDQTKSKFDIFNDGTNRCSFGASTNIFEYHSYTGSTHSFYINSVLSSLISANGFRTLGLRTGYVAKTATYTVLASDYTVECTANTFTVTLPSAVTVGAGTTFDIVNSGAGTITIGTTSSQTFINVTATPTTLTIVALGSRTVKSNGANWMLIASV